MYHPSTHEADTRGPWDKPCSQKPSSGFSKRLCFNQESWSRKTPDINFRLPCALICTCTDACTHVKTQVNVHRLPDKWQGLFSPGVLRPLVPIGRGSDSQHPHPQLTPFRAHTVSLGASRSPLATCVCAVQTQHWSCAHRNRPVPNPGLNPRVQSSGQGQLVIWPP